MITDYFKFAFRGIMHKGVRSWLTMVGIFIGIAAVVSLISLGQGLQDAVNKNFEMLGANIIMVMPGVGFGPSSASKITEHDKEIIERTRGVNLAGGMISKIAKVGYNGEVKYTWISGIPTDKSMKIIEDMQNIRLHEGRKFSEEDKYKVITTHLITEGDFFKKKVKVNDKITINDIEFRVIGSLEKIGNSQDDSSIYMPLKTSEELFNEHGNYLVILVQAKDGFTPSEVAEYIKKDMRRDRGQKEGEEDFSVQTQEQLKESVGSVLDAVQVVLIGIAAISLVVGGVGIMNTMYTSVLERTQEIGVMKAIGARNSDVMTIFLIESGVLGMVGGAMGVIIGLGLSKTVEYVAVTQLGEEMLKAHISWELIAGALLFSFIVGCVSGVLPAKQASELKPVDALRYE